MDTPMGPVPSTFGLRVPYPHFSGRKREEFLSPAVNRGDLRRLNYNKTGTPLRELTTVFQTPESDGRGVLPPHSSPLSPLDPRAPRSPSALVPPLFRPKLRPWPWIRYSTSLGLHLYNSPLSNPKTTSIKFNCMFYSIRAHHTLSALNDNTNDDTMKHDQALS